MNFARNRASRADLVGEPAPDQAARRLHAVRRWLTSTPVWLTGLVAVSVLVGTQLVPTSAAPHRERGPDLACADVAKEVGLTFRGEYGEIHPHGGANSAIMQRDMGNGAAVGDYDGDGWLDVFLGGQAGRPSKLFRNVAGDGGSRRFEDVTERAGLASVISNVRVAQFVDLN